MKCLKAELLPRTTGARHVIICDSAPFSCYASARLELFFAGCVGALSSVGRASLLQGEGRRFESVSAHQNLALQNAIFHKSGVLGSRMPGSPPAVWPSYRTVARCRFCSLGSSHPCAGIPMTFSRQSSLANRSPSFSRRRSFPESSNQAGESGIFSRPFATLANKWPEAERVGIASASSRATSTRHGR